MAILSALFFSSPQPPCETKRSLRRGEERLLLTSHWTSVNQMRQMIGRGRGDIQREGKNHQKPSGWKYRCAALVLYVFRRKTLKTLIRITHGYITYTIWFFHCSKQSCSEVFAAGDAFHLTLNRLVSTKRTFNTSGLLSTKVGSSRTDF